MSFNSWSQVNIGTTLPSTITQNFDGLPSGSAVTWADNSTPLVGLYGSVTDNSVPSTASFNGSILGTNAGSTGTANIYNYGSVSSTDRAIGAVSSSPISGSTYYIGMRLKNNSSSAITALYISYNGEQWRQNSVAQTMTFDYQIGSTVTSLSSGSWTAVSSLNFTAPNVGTAGALDGNLTANRTAISSTVASISIPAGSEIMLRWTQSGSNSHGLAVDDISITAFAVAPTITVSKTSLDFEKVYTGYHSLPQSYTVTGTNLAANITVTAPTGIEVTKTCGSGWSSTAILTQSSGSVNATVYARYTGGAISSNITQSTAGATTKNVSISETANSTNCPGTYYSAATGTGATLKTSLYNIINSHTSVSYNGLWTAYATTDEYPDGKIWDMYSGTDGCSSPAYEFTYNTAQCGSYSVEGDCYNREHSFPKSWFNEATPMYTDLFHIVPTDGKVNGERSNYPFGVVTSPTYTSSNGSKLGPNTYGSTYTGLAFEPNDAYKGDFARNYFYMATCYENVISGWQTNDPSGDAILDGTSFPCFEPWALQMLLAWNAADPVDQKEKSRNDAVYLIQGNRNPFIDHPEYVNMIWGTSPALAVSPSSLTGFTYISGGGPSTSQSFILSGSNLTGYTSNITVTAPSNFEVSTNNSTFATSVNIQYTSATLTSTSIYVRLKSGLSANTYTGSISLSGGGDPDGASVSVSGSVTSITPTLTVTPVSLTGFTYVSGSGPSSSQSFSLSGSYLTGYPSSITITAPSNFEVSTDNSTFATSKTVSYTSATLASTSIYVRLATGLAVNTYTGSVTLTGGGDADGASVSVSGSVTSSGGSSVCLTEGFINGVSAPSGWTITVGGTYTTAPYIGSATPSLKMSATGNVIETAVVSNATQLKFWLYGNGTPTTDKLLIQGWDGSTWQTIENLTPPTSSGITKTYNSSSTPALAAGYTKFRFTYTKVSINCGFDDVEVTCGSTAVPDIAIATANPAVAAANDMQGSVKKPIYKFTTAITTSDATLNSVAFTTTNSSSTDITKYQLWYKSSDDLSTAVQIGSNITTSLGTGTHTFSGLSQIISSGTTGYFWITADISATATVNNTFSVSTALLAGDLAFASGNKTVTASYSGGMQTISGIPIITLSTATLSGFSYIVGYGPSTQQTFTANGSYLTTDISITAPADYEISTTSGSGFGSSVTLTQSGGSVATTTIYVRLKASLIAGNYDSETITASSTGAASQTVSCNGSVSTPAISLSTSTLSGFTYIAGNGPSGQQTFTASGSNLTANISITAPADYEISTTSGSGFGSSVNLAQSGGIVNTTTIYVRLKASLSAGNYNSETITASTTGAASQMVSCNGTVISSTITISPSTLSGFAYGYGNGPSSQQTFTASGSNLTANISITAPTDYEISITSGTGFGSSVSLTQSSGTVATTTIYVRLKASLAIGTYNNETISASSTGATSQTVTCSGTVTSVTPVLTVSPSSLSGFTYVAGAGPSSSQTYNLSGLNLTGAPGSITISGSTNYEVSTDNSTFGASKTVAFTSATLASTPFYVRLKSGLSGAAYNGELIANSGGGASTVNIACYGTVSSTSCGMVTAFSDDFNRATLSPGGTPSMTYTSTLGTGVTASTISSSYLSIINNTTNAVSYVSGPVSTFSSPYSSTLSANTGTVTWTFNFRWNRPSSNNPAAPASGAYGQAIILASSSATFTSSTGYAVVYGNSSTPDPIRLVRFSGGVTGTLTNICSSAASDVANTNNYASVRVSYVPSTNTWSLYVRDDGASAWTDPSSGVTTQKGSSTVDNTYTATSLTHFGFLWTNAGTSGTSGDFDNFKVTVGGNPSPTPYSVTGGGSFCSGGSGVAVGLDNSQSGISYQLQVGSTSTGIPVTGTGSAISFGTQTTAGIYTIIATNTTTGCTTTMNGNASIVVNAKPTATATNNGPVCAGASLTLTGGPGSMTTYAWSGPLSYSNATQSPTVSANATTAMTGTYTLTVTDANGCTGTASTAATVNAKPVAAATNNGPVCAGAALTLTGGPGSMTTYAWSGPLSYSNATQSPTVSANATTAMTGTYTLTVTDANGCTGTASTAATVNAKPTATATNNGPVCAGAALTLTGGPGSMTTYAWSGPLSYSNATQSPTVSANATTAMTGTYTLTVTDANGCTGTASTAATVNAKPTATATNNGPVCAGASLTLTGGPGSMTTYAWSGPLSYSNATQSPTVSANATTAMTGTYTLTVTDANGCTGTASTAATVNTPVAVSVSISANPGTTILTGASVTFTANATNGGTTPSYQWKVNGSNVGTNSSTYTTNSLAHGDIVTCLLTSDLVCTSGNPATSNSLTMTVNKTVNLDVLLEGLFDSGSGQMHEALDGNTSNPEYGVGIADKITVVLHASTYPYGVVATIPNIVLHTDGSASLTLAGYTGSYYIAIQHRNSIEIWSANPISFATGTINYNFASSDSQTYGNNVKQVATGIYAAMIGDVNQDGVVDIFDLIDMDSDLTDGSAGFLVNDLNGDGVVDIFDLIIVDDNLTNGASIVTP